MAQITPPNRPTKFTTLVDPKNGTMSQEGLAMVESIWRQVASGFSVTPVRIRQTSVNILQLLPTMHEEGAENLANGMAFFGKAAATITGPARAVLKSNRKTQASLLIYKANGTTLTAAGDIVQNGMYMFVYHADLGGGAGGFVLK